MKNKYVGLLVISIAIILFFVLMSFNNALESIVNATCTHGVECTMNTTLKTQKIISYSLIGLLVIVGLFVTFFTKDESVKLELTESKKEISELEKKKKMENLDEEEKQIMNIIFKEKGSVFQSQIVKETTQTKVKITRILDRLEGKGLIERRRRGMTNIIILK